MNKYSRTLQGGCGVICDDINKVGSLIGKVSNDLTITAQMYIDFIQEIQDNDEVLIIADKKHAGRCFEYEVFITSGELMSNILNNGRNRIKYENI